MLQTAIGIQDKHTIMGIEESTITSCLHFKIVSKIKNPPTAQRQKYKTAKKFGSGMHISTHTITRNSAM
jgi:hypothetical protein